MTQPVKTLFEKRSLLLGYEAIGWLHMLGKANRHFLLHHGGGGDDVYKDGQWSKDLTESWENYWEWLKKIDKLEKLSSIDGILSKYRNKDSQKNAVGLLQAGHAMASGIEKNLPKNSSKYLGQEVTHMWLTTAYGKERRNLLQDPPDALRGDDAWRSLLQKVEQLLKDIEILGSSDSNDNVEQWWDIREKTIGKQGWLRKILSSTLAETRIPNNDVTLWDQSYVAASLFKSAAAGALLDKNFAWDDLKSQTQWRLLTVGIGTDHYEARAVRVGDWIGARKAIDRFFGEVQKFIEVELAVGSLLYRDDQVAVFSFPGHRLDGKSGIDNKTEEELTRCIEKKVDQFAENQSFETPPYIHLSHRSSRSLLFMSEEIAEAKETLATPIHRAWDIPELTSEVKGHICPVCGVRYNSKKEGVRKDRPTKDEPCPTCSERRTGRFKDWMEGKFERDTLWVSEVADQDGRVALLTLSLPVSRWLDGGNVDSLRAQAVTEWARHNPKVTRYGIQSDTAHNDLLTYIEKRLSERLNNNDPVLRILQDGYAHERGGWENYFSKIVEDRSNAPKWSELNNRERAAWLLHQFFRKNASPGRTYRFWRNAEEFFEEVLKKIREISTKDKNHWRVRRLVIQPDSPSPHDHAWKDREIYNGQCRGVPITLIYRKDLCGFLTASNVSRWIDRTVMEYFLDKTLIGTTCHVKGENENKLRTFTIKKLEGVKDHLGVYRPVIPLELNPERFRILVPLNALSECIDAVIESWNDHFIRVWDRMPLRIGVVAFPQKTSFQAVIDAARNLESVVESAREETWRVDARDDQAGVVALHLVQPSGQKELKTIPVLLKDGRKDVFYPYVAVEDSQIRFPLDFQTPRGQIYRHVQDLRRGDGVKIAPSRIAMLFLETTGKRFENFHVYSLSHWKERKEVWNLLLRLKPTTTALREVWRLMEDFKQRWMNPEGEWTEEEKGAWLHLVRSLLRDKLGADGKALDALVEAADMGVLEAALEWHIRILKLNLEEGQR
ncbi:MAG: CRISPR-associated protein Csx11 [Candidatus Carbobacillus altaicus]|uniref:CRISPR-associated protein Csx11 n=1 Tax=Candidatus Carbonibacillus altaicus TaxID=2163959 RepID=A0A2R6Y3N9_9BACL|nr:MAG: CRISPR-associated protein Csx11 [Candidatus Carbobacillus altaicus]